MPGTIGIFHPAVSAARGEQETQRAYEQVMSDGERSLMPHIRKMLTRLAEVQVVDCLMPHPEGDKTYQDPRRIAVLLHRYWSLCRSVVLDQTDAYIGFQPHPLLPLLVNMKARLIACCDGLPSLARVQEVKKTVIALIDALLAGDPDEFSAVPEWARGEVAKVDEFIAESRLSLGSVPFEPTHAEKAFLDFFGAEADKHRKRVEDAWRQTLSRLKVEKQEMDADREASGRAAKISQQSLQVPSSSVSGEPPREPEDHVVVDLVQQDDGWHWFVSGRDTGRVATNESRLIYKISRILFDQIGHGWVPHRTFYLKLGWTEEEYFDQDRMQKHLTILRKRLGLEVEFDKQHGVKFSANIVKAKPHSK
jgi:hypothetical protein